MNYQLRRAFNELVHAGLVDRKEYYALVEVLAEAPRLMPQHADDVAQAELLLQKLVDLVQLLRGPVGPEPRRQRVAIIGAPDELGAALAAWHAHPYGGKMDVVGIPLGEVSYRPAELHIERDLGPVGLGITIEDVMGTDMRGRGFGRLAQLFGAGSLLEALEAAERPVTIPPIKMAPENDYVPKKGTPTPKFPGYVGNRRNKYGPRR